MKLLFKFKIALLSFTVSGILLLTFGIALFAFIYSSGLERIDRELRSLAEVPLRGGHRDMHWTNFGDSLSFIYADRAEQIALTVLHRDGETLFQSTNYPVQLNRLIPAEWPMPAGGGDAQVVARLDRDNDGKISRTEFDGPAERFDFHDRNRDGFIEAAEMQGMPGPGPGGRGPDPRPNQPPRNPQGRPGGPDFSAPIDSAVQTVQIEQRSWRTARFSTPEVTVLIAMDMNMFNAEIGQFRTAFMIAVPSALILMGAVGWLMAGRAMKPVAAIAETAEGITARDLDKRIPMVGNDIELERLVDVSNNMLERLEKSYHQAVRFSADAAHELQTPLTILQGELDLAIQSSADGSEEQQRYSMLLDETLNLKAIVQKLLLLAHADEGRLNINPQPVDLSELIANAAEDMAFMAPELKIFTAIDESVTVPADPALLNQVIRNMASNAAKYSQERGSAFFTLTHCDKETRFTLSNTAPAIPEADCERLFDRFHRVDKSRSASGSGLGLSLAREIARAHGGDLVLNPYDDGMVSFTLSLPLT